MSLAARVRRLEDVMPGLREKLAPQLDLKHIERASFTRSGGHNILGRVELLEDAVEVLLTAQVWTGSMNSLFWQGITLQQVEVLCS